MTGEPVVRAVEVMEAIGADVPNEYTLGDVDDLAYPVKYDDLKLTIGDKVVYDDLMRVYETTPVFHPEDQAEYEGDQFDLNSLGVGYGTDVAGYDPDTFPFLLMVTLEKYVGAKVLYVVSRDGTIACLDSPSVDVVEDGINEIIESIHRTKPEGPTFIDDAKLPVAEATVESITDL
ncbi:hypothetical protein [Salinigranum marinum]|uniref:hypothetical protein n=1 Tax=Salinigranum marinum TaxID=1515595 RepID=UPI002989BC4A|nr:hypothetical protein [Salinigranum marinum]